MPADPPVDPPAGSPSSLTVNVKVSVAFSPRPGEVDETVLRVPAGSTLADAVAASGLQARHPAFDLCALPTGIWGALAASDQRLGEGDRVELYRPLTVDPKEARRLRYRASGGGAKRRADPPSSG